MKFTVIRNSSDPLSEQLADELTRVFVAEGHVFSPTRDGIQFALNLTSLDAPKAYLRRSQSVFVFSIVTAHNGEYDLRSRCYTGLVQSLSNLFLCVVPSDDNGSGSSRVYFTTPEAGYYDIPFDAYQVYKRLLPIAGAHFATANIFATDLPVRFYESSPVIEKIKLYGKELEHMGVLPTPFPLREILSESAMRHLYKIYGITGASYGNLSAREEIPELGSTTFWMTGRGIDKADIRQVGKDLLLVKGFDHTNGAALLSMPEGFDPRARVSVDAVEHELIYSTFPDVGAIVHAHAWMDGVRCTRQNYPCGTRELAEEVVDLLRQADQPCQTAVGLKNHGLTITGRTLDDIFERIRGKLLTEVQMFA
jgi:ribulose-5-phosphate 4-epimerase/fuculose-1-phosphate aldolase